MKSRAEKSKPITCCKRVLSVFLYCCFFALNLLDSVRSFELFLISFVSLFWIQNVHQFITILRTVNSKFFSWAYYVCHLGSSDWNIVCFLYGINEFICRILCCARWVTGCFSLSLNSIPVTMKTAQKHSRDHTLL